MRKLFTKAFILPLIIAIAVVLVVYKINSKPPIDHVSLKYPIKTVEIITAKTLSFRSRAVAFGSIEAATTLAAKAEINGKISYIHPDLKQGASLAQGTVILRIEPTEFEFSLEQSKAGLASSEHSLKQLEVEQKTTQQFLKIALRNFEIGRKDLEGSAKLLTQKVISSSKYNLAEQKQLQLQQQVEDLQGKVASFPSRTAVLVAQINKSKAQLGQSQDILNRTEIRLPFAARIGSVFVEKDEYVGVGGKLFEALGLEAVEVIAQLSLKQFSSLLVIDGDQELQLQSPEQIQSQFKNINLDVNIQLVQGIEENTIWRGELMRISEAVDPTTNTIGLVVKVENPYDGVLPGKKPPLLKGMFVRVEFVSTVIQQMVLPRKTIHQGRVYIADKDDKLEIRPVMISRKQGELVVVATGIENGDRIIITDLVPVIVGQPLKMILADEVEKQLAIDAFGASKNGDAK
ncbi:MAG: HlyD family secretion protein [Rhizobiales bacterium]|nr:hypothetical protein [Hyphomicrobiales bacterium]NRB15885.1 HlyD family secretion protein [Hyphomicrobiales bacterium]